jgi:hypothetical protein
MDNRTEDSAANSVGARLAAYAALAVAAGVGTAIALKRRQARDARADQAAKTEATEPVVGPKTEASIRSAIHRYESSHATPVA